MTNLFIDINDSSIDGKLTGGVCNIKQWWWPDHAHYYDLFSDDIYFTVKPWPSIDDDDMSGDEMMVLLMMMMITYDDKWWRDLTEGPTVWRLEILC